MGINRLIIGRIVEDYLSTYYIMAVGLVSFNCARRDGNRTTSKGFVEILNFRHFVKHTVFERADEKEKTKSIKSWVPVSVVVELECVDM